MGLSTSPTCSVRANLGTWNSATCIKQSKATFGPSFSLVAISSSQICSLSALLSTKVAKACLATPVALLGVPTCLPPVLGKPLGFPPFLEVSILDSIPIQVID